MQLDEYLHRPWLKVLTLLPCNFGACCSHADFLLNECRLNHSLARPTCTNAIVEYIGQVDPVGVVPHLHPYARQHW